MTGNINFDFFEQNSELTLLEPLRQLRKKYKKEEASKIMWAIYLIEHPNSTFYRIPREDRIKEVKENYYDIDLEKHQDIIECLKRFILTKEEAMLKYFFDLLDKLIKKLDNVDLDSDRGIKTTIEALEKTPKIFENLRNIQNNLKQANDKTKLKGGGSVGAREGRDKKTKQQDT